MIAVVQFVRQFLIDGFERGDYTYGTLHVVSIALMLVSIPLLVLHYRKQTEEVVRRDLVILAWITLFFYIIRRGVEVYQGKPLVEAYWPFYLCNVNTVGLSLLLIFDIRKGRDFFLVTGMSGAILMFVVPEGVFNDRYLTLQIFESLLSHYMIFIVPIILFTTRRHDLDVRNAWQAVLGLLLVLFNVEFLQELVTGRYVDYLFLSGPIDLSLWGIPQVFVMLFLAILYVYLVYALDYVFTGRWILSSTEPLRKKG